MSTLKSCCLLPATTPAWHISHIHGSLLASHSQIPPLNNTKELRLRQKVALWEGKLEKKWLSMQCEHRQYCFVTAPFDVQWQELIILLNRITLCYVNFVKSVSCDLFQLGTNCLKPSSFWRRSIRKSDPGDGLSFHPGVLTAAQFDTKWRLKCAELLSFFFLTEWSLCAYSHLGRTFVSHFIFFSSERAGCVFIGFSSPRSVSTSVVRRDIHPESPSEKRKHFPSAKREPRPGKMKGPIFSKWKSLLQLIAGGLD